MLLELSLLAALLAAGASAPSPGRSPFPDAAGVDGLLAGIGNADLVLFDEPRANQATRILLATRVKAAPEKLMASIADPASFRRAIPSFQKAEVVARSGNDKLVEWELEVPLWNLEGKLWLRPRAGGVDLQMAEGDLSPGLFALRVRPGSGGGAILTIEARANVRNANWVARRLVTRSFHAEAAMTASAAWVLLRALVLDVEQAGGARWPKAKMSPPGLPAVDGRAVGDAAKAAALATGLGVAAVRARADGRLERVEVAVTARAPLGDVQRHVSDPNRWRALPGWRQIRTVQQSGNQVRWEVDTKFPFVDFDSTWLVRPGPPLRGQAVEGDCRGAIMGWDLLDGPRPRTTIATFSFHPRLETSGYVPRKFIEAEPLLEHGLSLGLAYVNAASLVRSMEWFPTQPQPQPPQAQPQPQPR